MSYGIAIAAINGVGKEQEIGVDDKLILTCEFISSLDLDTEFEKYLMEKFTQE